MKPRVLVGCEESQRVCIAFRQAGFDAWSCDILPCSGGYPEYHIQDDVLNVIRYRWELAIFHPPCTFLTCSQNRWMFHPDDSGLPSDLRRPHPMHPNRKEEQQKAVEFFMALTRAPIPRIAIENPVGIMSTHYRKPDQIVQPYWFGDPYPKRTCLWLKNLPPLHPTNMVDPEYVVFNSRRTKSGKSRYSVHGKLGKGYGSERSKTFPGLAAAMADQWGNHLNPKQQSFNF